MPAPQDGDTPADLAAKYNDNAEVKAFFASGQVRPIRVHSEGTRRALRGTRRHSEALRGRSEALRGRSEALGGTRRHSEALGVALGGTRRRHSAALSGH